MSFHAELSTNPGDGILKTKPYVAQASLKLATEAKMTLNFSDLHASTSQVWDYHACFV